MFTTVTGADEDNEEPGYVGKYTSPLRFLHSLQSHIDPGSG